MVRSPRGGVHPVCHLLLSLFLDGQPAADQPFGDGPWPCRNPFASHCGALTIDAVEVRRDRDVRYGDFRCTCGYHYTRALLPNGSVGLPRYRSFGALLAPALAKMIDDGVSLRSAAARAGLDPRTLMREAAMHGIAVPWSTKPSGAVSSRTTEASVRPLAIRRQRKRRLVRNWEVVDLRLEREVEKAVQDIRGASPAVRVTIAEIERRVAFVRWIARRATKLPRTWSAARLAVEPVDTYRNRRLVNILDDLGLSLPDSTPSDVLRKAGLPMSWLPEIRVALIERCGRFDAKRRS